MSEKEQVWYNFLVRLRVLIFHSDLLSQRKIRYADFLSADHFIDPDFLVRLVVYALNVAGIQTNHKETDCEERPTLKGLRVLPLGNDAYVIIRLESCDLFCAAVATTDPPHR